MKIDQIHNDRFYAHRSGYTIKVVDKNYKSYRISIEKQQSDYRITKSTCRHEDIVVEVLRTKWDVMPRSKEPASFSLKSDYTIPTNNTMYECRHCVEDGVDHEITDVHESKFEEDTDLITRRKSWWETGHYRVCSGCKRKDGPWVPYGDD